MVLHIRGCLHEKTHTGVSFIPGWLFDFVLCLYNDSLGHFISPYLKVHIMLIKYMCDSKSQTFRMHYPFQFYRQTDFIPKRVVVSHLHDTAARFRTRAKFSPRYNGAKVAPVSCKHPLRWKLWVKWKWHRTWFWWTLAKLCWNNWPFVFQFRQWHDCITFIFVPTRSPKMQNWVKPLTSLLPVIKQWRILRVFMTY